MPYAAGELCLQHNHIPVDPHGHQCRGGCGGRLHGNCGDVEGESEIHRICPACVSSKQASTAAAGKRKAQGAGSIPKRTKAGGGRQADRSAPRTRLSLDQKMELLADLDRRVSQGMVAEKFNCSVRTVQSIKQKRKRYEEEAARAKGSQKSDEASDSEGEDEEDGEEDGDGSLGRGRGEPPS